MAQVNVWTLASTARSTLNANSGPGTIENDNKFTRSFLSGTHQASGHSSNVTSQRTAE
jgi:hypothetical protein